MKNKAKIFVIDDDELITTSLSKLLKNEGYLVQVENEAFHQIAPLVESLTPDLVLLDIKLPGRNGIEILEELKARNIQTPVIMLTSDDSAETAVKCMKLGAVDYLTKPFNLDEVRIVINGIMEREQIKHEVKYLRKVYSEFFDKEIIAESPVFRELKVKMEKIARAHVPNILITGESGTGKELVARSIHRIMHEEGTNGQKPFIAVNCTALPEHLLESELFGYEKGAFTDAKTEKKGILELADGGTILLDEIGDMKTNLQSKLLRVLEDRTIRRIGGNKEISIDETVIATTNRNLEHAVEKGEFRVDLLYRLNIFSLHVPPLRERREDIPALTKYFLASFAESYRNKTIKGVAPEAQEMLDSYAWPGNVRELRNVIERIVVLENSEMIMPWHLPKEITSLNPEAKLISPHKFILPENGLSLEDLERDLIQQALEKAQHNRVLAAKLLNMSYDSLRYQIKKFGLDL